MIHRRPGRAATWASLLGIALISLVVPSAAPAQERGGRPAGLEERLSPQTFERLRSIEQRAERAGVPPELLWRKANEGVSKGITGARLEQALDAYASRLGEAVQLAGRGAAPDVLEAAAGAAERGVPADRIRSFITLNPNPMRSVVGLRVLGDLVELGVSDGEAARAVNAALDRGMRGDRLLALSAAVRRRTSAGEDPVAALRAELDRRP